MKLTVKNFYKIFSDDNVCLDVIFKHRYSELKVCPNLKCGKDTIFHRRNNRKCYSCQWCGHCISPLVGTIFQKSTTSLQDWFFVIFLFAHSKNGVSAKEVERHLGVTYKCAWRICKQIRALFDENNMLSGIVEVDETYIGGKEKNKHKSKKIANSQGRSTKSKDAVIGAVEKDGKIVAKVSIDTKDNTIKKFLREHVAIGTQLHTDEYNSYNNVKNAGYLHDTCNHSHGKYVTNNEVGEKIHTNNIEGFWSQLKRSIHGTYHCVSPKYLQNYINEFSFRYNLRKDEMPIFYHILERVCNGKENTEKREENIKERGDDER